MAVFYVSFTAVLYYFFRYGCFRVQRPYCKIGTPQIFFARGVLGTQRPPLVYMWEIPHFISKTVTARKLKFYKHLDRVKFTFRE